MGNARETCHLYKLYFVNQITWLLIDWIITQILINVFIFVLVTHHMIYMFGLKISLPTIQFQTTHIVN